MQSKSQDDGRKRHNPPQPGQEQARHVPGKPGRSERPENQEGYPGQEDQWAVFRHEMEEEELARGDELKQADWEQRDARDTEDNALASSSLYDDAQMPNQVDIVVAGIGGGGMNAVNRMIHTRVRGVRFVAMNTDAQVLNISQAPNRICLGQRYTKGLGSGGNAGVGARAAAESAEEIQAALGKADLVFIAAGMGGGTGTGGAPVVASLAKKMGALTIGIVTLPFSFEGYRRRRVAEEGLGALGAEVDALITVPNDRLLAVTGRDSSLAEAFELADDVLRQGVQGIAEVINVPGLVNVDFADVRSVLREAGTALMSIGQGQGRNRAQKAAEEAVAGGFLNVAIRGAQRVLFNISGGEDMTLFEVNEVAELIGNAIDATADITFGAVIDPSLDDVIRVTLIAAGMQELRTGRIPSVRLEQPLASRVPPIYSPAHQRAEQNIPTSPRPPQAHQAYQAQQEYISEEQEEQAPPVARPFVPPLQTERPPLPQGRPQRSLDDLRGLRSMGRRQEMLRRGTGEDNALYEEEGVDVPPFMKKHP